MLTLTNAQKELALHNHTNMMTKMMEEPIIDAYELLQGYITMGAADTELVTVYRPAYRDHITMTVADLRVAVDAIAFSTINMLAAQFSADTVCGVFNLTKAQLGETGPAYHNIMRNASKQVRRWLD